MQNFKNYVPFNIPITDIFKRKGAAPGGDGPKRTLFHIQNMELRYPDISLDPDDPPEQLREERKQ